jgi:hypothetical protein
MTGIDAARHSDDRPRRPTRHELIAGTTTPSPSAQACPHHAAEAMPDVDPVLLLLTLFFGWVRPPTY